MQGLTLFVEGVDQARADRADRGEIYCLITARPDNRRPLTWEPKQIDLLIVAGRISSMLAEGIYPCSHQYP